jgi:MFS family permease
MFKLKYFNNKLSPGFVALFSGRMIQFIASCLLGLFLPIFLFTKLNYRIEYVFLYFAAGWLLYGLLLPIGAQLLNKIGLRRSLRISVFLDGLYYACLYFVDKDPYLFLTLSMVVITLDRLMFWLPYHTDFAKFTDQSNRGKEVSLMYATHSFLSIIMPVVAGYIIVKYGFNAIFVMAIIIYLAAGIPYLVLPRTEEKYSWGVWETWKKYFALENRKLVISNMANGAENVVGIIIWPIFIWQILKGDYLEVGAISSLIVLVSIIFQLFAGKYTDLINKRKILHWGSALYALGWVAKIFVLTAFHIFIIGAYHEFTKIFKDTPFDTLNYEIMAKYGHYVDEYTVLKEIAIQFGRVLMLILAIAVALNFGLNWTFGLAALTSLLINLL